MRKWHEKKWQEKSAEVYSGTVAALSLVLENLNPGQRQKLLKNESVAELMKRYGVSVDA